MFRGAWVDLYFFETLQKLARPQLFKHWIALSTGRVTIQWIIIWKTICIMHCIEIYPVGSAIHFLNNWGQML